MTDKLNTLIDGTQKIAESGSKYGLPVVIIAAFIVVMFLIITVILIMLMGLQKTLINGLKDSLKTLSDTVGSLEGSFIAMNDSMNVRQNELKEYIDNLEDKINQAKCIPAEQFGEYCKAVMLSTIHNIKDDMLGKIESNNLYKNKSINIDESFMSVSLVEPDCEIYSRIKYRVQEGRAKIGHIRFSKIFLDELFSMTDKMMLSAFEDLRKVFDVANEDYDKDDLIRRVRNIAYKQIGLVNTVIENQVTRFKEKKICTREEK